jgi:flagellar basal-body rod modification protein FlgD
MSTVSALQPNSTAGTTASGFSSLSSQDFAKIIFTELSKQDPLQPSDTNALIQQISGIRSIQSNMDLSNSLSSLVNQNEFSSAATLIGKSVSGLSDGNARVSGLVRSVSRTSTGAVLELTSGDRVPVQNVDQILPGTTP